MMQKKLDKEDFKRFFEDLKEEFKIYGPTKKGTISAYNFGAFDYIDNFKWLNLDRLPISPPKRLLMPDGEVLFNFKKKGDEVILEDQEKGWPKKRLILGVKTCDIASLEKLDKVLGYDDPQYSDKRKDTVIIGITCNKATDSACFCSLVKTGPDIDSGYDLLMTDIGGSYFFRSGTPEGERLLQQSYFKDISPEDLQARADKLAEIQKELDRINNVNLDDIKGTLEKKFDSEVWDRFGKRCVSCGSCTMVCPTCHCFNILDKANLAKTEGKRVRIMDSCHFDQYGKMAGGFDTRPGKASKLKHRLYDKFLYANLTHGEGSCVGCGRCIRHCQCEIDIRQVLGELKDE
jgi:sulfhydrogenase subunit beta (sulfur reductase)